jgi:hypothetical protein
MFSDYCKALLGKSVLSGMEEGLTEVNSNARFTVGIGMDQKGRTLNSYVNHKLATLIKAAQDPLITVKTVNHGKGHSLEIRHRNFIIYPKHVDYKNSGIDDDPNYHRDLISRNPSKQYELFDIYDDTKLTIFVQLLFGKKNDNIFAFLSIPDSSGGIYECESLALTPSDIFAPEEKIKKSKEFVLRKENVAGQ